MQLIVFLKNFSNWLPNFFSKVQFWGDFPDVEGEK